MKNKRKITKKINYIPDCAPETHMYNTAFYKKRKNYISINYYHSKMWSHNIPIQSNFKKYYIECRPAYTTIPRIIYDLFYLKYRRGKSYINYYSCTQSWSTDNGFEYVGEIITPHKLVGISTYVFDLCVYNMNILYIIDYGHKKFQIKRKIRSPVKIHKIFYGMILSINERCIYFYNFNFKLINVLFVKDKIISINTSGHLLIVKCCKETFVYLLK